MRLFLKFFHFIEGLMHNPRFSIWRTVYFNFRTLPIGQAIHLPLRIYGRIKMTCLDGKIVLQNPRKPLRIGLNIAGFQNTSPGMFNLRRGGMLKIEEDVLICQGACITVGENALLTLKHQSALGDGALVICCKNISIGAHSDVTWGCQVMDFNSHFIQYGNGEIPSIFKTIVIGDYCWIGNRTTVMPGTKLPDRIIVCSNSLLNKDYNELCEPYSMIGGQPARLLKSDVRRIYDQHKEADLISNYKPRHGIR